MTIERYRALINRLCSRFNIPKPGPASQVAHLNAYGAHFTLFFGGLLAPDSMLVHCDFGVVPAPPRDPALLRLLEINTYLFGAHQATFAYDAERNRIVLICRVRLQYATLHSVLETLEHLSFMARDWQRNRFLHD